MALTSTVLYSAITVGSSATPQAPYHVTQLLPQVTAVTGNAVVFNFVAVSGSTTSGHNARIVFNYGFSMATYDATLASTGIISTSKLNLRFPTAINSTFDSTTQISVPILGNNLYYWLDVDGLIAPVTLTVNAVPLVISNQTFAAK